MKQFILILLYTKYNGKKTSQNNEQFTLERLEAKEPGEGKSVVELENEKNL